MPHPKKCIPIAVAALLAFPAAASAVPMVAVSTAASPTQTVAVLDTGAPATFTGGPTPITGLGTDERVVGIDYRPSDQLLYAIGRTPATGAGRLYRLDPTTGVATAVGASFGTLTGTNFDVDFNPVADRLRIVSDADYNARVNPDTGALTGLDGTLAFAAGDANSGDNPEVSAAAYTNSFPGSTSTTLYDIDFGNRVLAIQNPPNAGTLNTVGTGLPSNPSAVSGLDIADPSGTAYASFTSDALPTTSYLYTVNLATGGTVLVGSIGAPGTVRYPFIAAEPAPTFSASDLVTGEGTGTATVTVSRRTKFAAATVDYATVDGTATAGSDYTATSGTLSFAAGETAKTVSIPITNDTSDEGAGNETFRLRLSNAAPGRVDPLDARIAIVDDDAPKQTPPTTTTTTTTPPTPEDTPPSVAFTSPPVDDLPVLAPVALAATARDDQGVVRVDFRDGERLIASDSSAPYTAVYLPAATDLGRRSLVAVAFDAKGQTQTAVLDRTVAPLTTRLSATTTPKRDAEGPRSFTTSGAVAVPAAVAKAEACKGARVTVRLTAGSRTVATKRAVVSSTCSYRIAFSLKASKRLPASLVPKAALAATPVLRAASATSPAVKTR